MTDLLDGLNEAQIEAVTETLTQPTLVLAGAGSGKTGVLTKRAAHLVLNNNVSPSSIMVVTFTTKAAKEMKQRVANLIGEKEANKLAMGTFHSTALTILRKHGKYIGLKARFTIYDTDDQKQIIRQACALHGYPTDANSIRMYMSRISDAKNKLLTPVGYRNQLTSRPQVMPQDLEVAKVYESYQQLLEKNNAVDFDDLILKTVLLLEKNPDIKKYYNDRYKYVMIDEYQDSNPAQYRMMMNILGKNNIFVVGDDAQSIYGFRGSDIGIILNFEKDFPNCKIVKLEQNYRSTKTVVHAGNCIIQHNKMQKHKVVFTENEMGDRVKMYTARDGLAEARFIVEEIENQVRYNKRDFKDFAILYRMNFMSQEIERQLTQKRIPYHIVGGVSFFERMEIKDTMAYLRVIANPLDDIAFRRILNMAPGIGKKTIEGVEDLAEMQNLALAQALRIYVSPRIATAHAIDALRELLNELRRYFQLGKTATDTPVSDMLELVWRKTGYRDNLVANGDDESLARVDNLDELMKVAVQYEKDSEDEASIIGFLEETTLTTSDDPNSNNKVQLMTVHASKGLEFPVVFCPGWEEGIFPSKRATTDEEIAEERRLAYVAVTRAEKEIYITNAKSRLVYREQQYNSPSRFIDEIPAVAKEEL